MSTPASGLEAAFRATTYRVETPAGRFDLRIGEPLPAAFAGWLRAEEAAFWGIVTAHNPGARRLSAVTNRLADEALARAVATPPWRRYAALNLADGGDWPNEPGWLLLGGGQADLCALGRRFAQAAVVCGTSEGVPQLCWL